MADQMGFWGEDKPMEETLPPEPVEEFDPERFQVTISVSHEGDFEMTSDEIDPTRELKTPEDWTADKLIETIKDHSGDSIHTLLYDWGLTDLYTTVTVKVYDTETKKSTYADWKAWH